MRKLVSTLLLFAMSLPLLAANVYYKPGDFISVHWDSSYDYDDLQAMVATREVFDAYPGVNHMVVNGARSHEHSGILAGSSAIMRMVFPYGLDAHHARSNAINVSADRWQTVLQSGGTVHVADGGPSDFTADVIRELQARHVSDLKRIRVVQHSPWNENKTSISNLQFVKKATSYVKIPNGNNANQTARLRADGAQTQAFRNLVGRSLYSDVWDVAMQAATDPKRVVDFSDTVEVLHILNVPTSAVADAFDFAYRYFGQGTLDQNVPERPVSPLPTVSTERVAVYGDNLSAAIAAYQQATTRPRIDCDPSGSGYICASFNNPTLADVEPVAVPMEQAVSETSVGPTDSTEPAASVSQSGRVAVYGSNLSSAKANYAAVTSLPRLDCDPSGGGYICASFNNPTLADIEAVAVPMEQAVSEAPAGSTDSAEPAASVSQSGRVAVYGGNLSSAKANYAAATSLPRRDCDPSGGGYICASFNNPTSADITAGGKVSEPVNSQVTSTSSSSQAAPVVNGENTIRIEVENYKLGDGWLVDTARSGYSGNGYIRWTGGNLYHVSQAGAGVMQFNIVPTANSEYAIRLRSRAINPPASDKNNDVWIRLDGSTWKKMYNAGRDEWLLGGAIDDHNGHYLLKKNLTSGKNHLLEISGRSNGFAIDYIELTAN